MTYEEVIDATTSQGLIQTEEKSRDRMGGSSARQPKIYFGYGKD